MSNDPLPPLSQFSDRIGQPFDITSEHGSLAMTLEEARELPGGVRPEGSFVLTFRGPTAPILAQAIYGVATEGLACELFLVPVGQNDLGTLYEAIIN